MTKETEVFSLSQEVLGMTLRDWFAGQALQGMISFYGSYDGPESAAYVAYSFADAMLKGRSK